MTNAVISGLWLERRRRARLTVRMKQKRPHIARSLGRHANPGLIAVLLAALWAPVGARAELHALVVGVSDYEWLDADLRGPANDVRLVSEMLLKRGAKPENIAVLAAPDVRLDPRLAVAGLPRRQAILSGLAALSQTAQPGDTVFFYFSGHGSQAPDRNGDESGGYDEILLPADAKGWKGAIGAVENAIVDDEFSAALSQILARDVRVIAVLDACHAATGFRGVAGGSENTNAQARYVTPAQLGVPAIAGGATADRAAADAAAQTGDSGQPSQPGMRPLGGDFVFLYAAQSDQRAFEYPLATGADGEQHWYGDFTRALMDVLSRQNGLSWAQSLQAATDQMQRNGPAIQTPSGEGTLLDMAVFGATTPAPARLRFERGQVQAGALMGLSSGAQVAIYDRIDAPQPMMRATLGQVTADRATLQATAALPATGYVQVEMPGPPPMLHLATPLHVRPNDGHDYAPLEQALSQIEIDEVQIGSETPDMGLFLVDGTLALVGRDGVLDPFGPNSSPRMPAAPGADVAAALVPFLDRAARRFRLNQGLSLAQDSTATGFALPGSGLQIALTLAPVPASANCDGPVQPVAPVQTPVQATPCDQLWLKLENSSRIARDVTVLYVDGENQVSALWPEPGLSNRLNFGESQEIGLQLRLPKGRTGVSGEELIVISLPAQDHAPRVDLSALASPEQQRNLPQTPAGDALSHYMGAALNPDLRSRGFNFGGTIPPIQVKRFSVHLAAAPASDP